MSLKRSLKTFCKGLFLLLFAFNTSDISAQASFGWMPSNSLSKPVSVFSTNSIVKDSLKDKGPRNATLLSTFIPGAGQIYNKKYWKVPIIYAGIGALIYFIDQNSTQSEKYAKAYTYATDDDTTTNPGSIDPRFAFLPAESFRQERDEYRDLRDLSILLLAGVYALQIIDANVDAHLKEFDVGDDLTMSFRPKLGFNPFTRSINQGFSLSIGIKNKPKFRKNHSLNVLW